MEHLSDEQKAKCQLLGVVLVYMPDLRVWMVRRTDTDKWLRMTKDNLNKWLSVRKVYAKSIEEAIALTVEFIGQEEYWG